MVANLGTHGAKRLLDQDAVLQLRRSTNAECPASIDIFRSDKTGTLTTTNISLQEPYCITCDVVQTNGPKFGGGPLGAFLSIIRHLL